MSDLFGLGDGVRTLSVVPVGLTKYNVNRPVRPLSPEEAREAVAQVNRFREGARKERGQGWVYAADEMYLRGGLPLPPLAHYDRWDLTENGVGAVARFLEAFRRGIRDVPRLEGRRIRILTGESMEPFMKGLAPRIAAATGASVLVHKVANRFYGKLVTVAGLLGGKDLLEAASDPQSSDLILLPREALNADDLFIDSFSLPEFRKAVAPARVLPALEITEALRSL
jgi:NifB/MoaA-like Fe-S oxidoreductase